MNFDLIIFSILLIFLVLIEATQTNDNETLTEELRKPRVNGRIVKLYSGTRPEPFLCPTEGFHLDPADCAVFYRCVRAASGKYTVFRFQCGPGTVYDPVTEVCNHPRSTMRSECGGSTSSSIQQSHENEIDKTEQELPTPISTRKPVYTEQITLPPASYPWATSTKRQISETPNSSVTTAYPWISTTTANKSSVSPQRTLATRRPNSQDGDPCTSDGFMGDSENCRKFYRCVGNQRGGYIRYEFSCSESTIWDEGAQSCNHPWAVQKRRCGRGNSQDNKPSTIEQSMNNKPNTTMQQQTQISYGSKVSQTQTQISHGTVVQNQTQIHYGDRLNQKHDSGAKQNQTQISYGSAVSQLQTQIDYGNKGLQTQLQVDHTKQSSQTQAQVYESYTKTTTTLSQNDEDQGYDAQSNVDSQESNDNENKGSECTESGFMGDKNDCKKFYRCVDNGKGGYTKYEFSCGEGTVWDSKIEACNHAWAVKECGGQTPDNNTPQSEPPATATTTTKTTTQNYYTSSEQTTEDDEDIPYGNPNQQPISPTSTVQPKPMTTPEHAEETVCTSSGFIGDANDCKKFYRCVDNGGGSYTKYEFKCGEGTVWDPDIEACNHAWAVKKCGGSSSENDINKIEHTTTSTSEISAITTVSLIQTTTQMSAQNTDYDTGYGQQSNESPSTTTTTKQPQTGVSEESNKCSTSGFMGDKNDCKKFYRCVDNGKGAYTRYEFSCGEGTNWDPKIEACNHAWAVEKCGSEESADIHKETTVKPRPTMSDEEINTSKIPQKENETEYPPAQSTTPSSSPTTDSPTLDKDNECQENGFMGDIKDCKKFYRCVDNGKGGYTRYDFSCGEGTVWDQSIEGCNHAWSVDNCGSKGNYSTQIQLETTSQIYSTSTSENEDQGYYPTSEKTTTSTNETPRPPASEICVKEGFVGDHTDCKKFYRCVDNGRGGYLKYEFSCGKGTVWDSDINTCNHPSPGRSCGVSENESVSKEPDRENDEIYTENTTSSSTVSTENEDNTSSTEKSSTTSGICKSEGFYGDPNDCKKFYRCVDNGKGGHTKYDFICGDGTVWDQEIQACNHESSNTHCSKVPSTESQTQGTENYTSSKPANTEKPESTDDTKAPPSSSNNKCTAEGFFANSEDCKKFFRCVSKDNGEYTKYDFTCGEGTVWVQEIQTCDHENGISNCSKQSGTTAQFDNEQQSSTTVSLTSSESSQSQKPDKEDDEYPSESSSESTSSGSEECTSEGFYANKKDCKRFYRCVDNGHGGYTKYEFACGEGTAWDSDIQTCNHINEVESCQDSYQEESQSKPVVQDEETSQSSETTTKTSTSGSTTGSAQPANNDKCEQEGYFGNTEDCRKFYRCVDNGKGAYTKYDYTCGEGTIWDQDITTCNHPQDVSNRSCKQSDDSTSSTTSSPSSTTGPSSQSTSSTDENNSQGSSNCSQEDSSKKPANQNVTCTKAGYYADSNDCKKFYRCVDWDGDGKRFSVYHFDCGEGTIWDPALETCNHEDSVYPPRDCSGTQSQNENINSESTTTEEMTSEQTTTQQTATNTPTTIQQTTTSEHTTAQQTTSDQTTAQSTTTSEQTTTQQTTTSEQTTSVQTTNQPTTTSKQTTTEQTTSEHTTSEQTTTQQTTTNEQTTIQQTTTSEQTTAHQTTSEQTTTQQTSSEQTTTQQSTTEQTTTQSSGGEDTTTQQESSTTEQYTTTENNDQQNSTQQSSNTEETTTQEYTTEQQSSTDESQITEESTTSQQTDESSTTDNGQGTTESSSSPNKDCPETENDQNLFVCPTSFRRHPKYCNLFYQCTEDDDNHDVKIAVFNCPNNTIYDESKTKCVEEDKADKKCDGEIAQRRRVKRLDTTYKEPIVVSQESLQCPAVGYFPFEKEECSSAFLKCRNTKSGKLRGYVYQCPEGYVYWSVSKRCEAKSNVRFCKKSYNNWNGRWEIPIERRNVAP